MIAAGLTLVAFFALAAGMQRHAPVLLGGWQRHARQVRWIPLGYGLLALALVAALASSAWPVALVTWFGLLPFAAGLILLGLSYDVRIARGAAALGCVLVLAGLVR